MACPTFVDFLKQLTSTARAGKYLKGSQKEAGHSIVKAGFVDSRRDVSGVCEVDAAVRSDSKVIGISNGRQI